MILLQQKPHVSKHGSAQRCAFKIHPENRGFSRFSSFLHYAPHRIWAQVQGVTRGPRYGSSFTENPFETREEGIEDQFKMAPISNGSSRSWLSPLSLTSIQGWTLLRGDEKRQKKQTDTTNVGTGPYGVFWPFIWGVQSWCGHLSCLGGSQRWGWN